MIDANRHLRAGIAGACTGMQPPAGGMRDTGRPYDFFRYVSKERWISFGYQVHEIISVKPGTILEIGVGPGLLGAVLKHLGYDYKSVDIDAALNPDHIASVMHLPFHDASFDAVGCFQVLEHIHYEDMIPALREIARVSRGYVILSLPDARRVYSGRIHVPGLGQLEYLLPRPQMAPVKHVFDGQHYWEINKRGFPLQKILKDISAAGLIVEKTYRVPENPYHRMFRLKKR